MALKVTPADQGDRAQVAALAEEVQQVTGNTVELAYVDQGYTGPKVAEAAQPHGIHLEVVKHPMAKRGFALLPRRWVIERGSPGSHASEGSPATTNDSTQASKAST
jgi:transposase